MGRVLFVAHGQTADGTGVAFRCVWTKSNRLAISSRNNRVFVCLGQNAAGDSSRERVGVSPGQNKGACERNACQSSVAPARRRRRQLTRVGFFCLYYHPDKCRLFIHLHTLYDLICCCCRCISSCLHRVCCARAHARAVAFFPVRARETHAPCERIFRLIGNKNDVNVQERTRQTSI